MARRITVNIGFITNSSSCVHWYPKELLQDEEVAAFIEAYELQEGFVSDNLWNRRSCTSFAPTLEKRQELADAFEAGDSEYYHVPGMPAITKDDMIVLVYGDEYITLVSELNQLLSKAAEKQNLASGGTEYN